MTSALGNEILLIPDGSSRSPLVDHDQLSLMSWLDDMGYVPNRNGLPEYNAIESASFDVVDAHESIGLHPLGQLRLPSLSFGDDIVDSCQNDLDFFHDDLTVADLQMPPKTKAASTPMCRLPHIVEPYTTQATHTKHTLSSCSSEQVTRLIPRDKYIEKNRGGSSLDWDFIRDSNRRASIVRWKAKRAKILRGETNRQVYEVRVRYAAKRKRVGGRFAYG